MSVVQEPPSSTFMSTLDVHDGKDDRIDFTHTSMDT